MARFTPILGQLSGKVAGNVFSRNKGGSYLKRWVKPTNPRTNAQGAARGNFSVAASSWNNLALNVKSGWNTYALSAFTPKIPRAGATYSGFSAYQSLNNALRNAARSKRANIITAPPAATMTQGVVTPPANAPSGIFGGQIVVTTGVYSSLSLGPCTLTVSGAFTAQMNLSVPTGITAPIFVDPVSTRAVGLVWYGGRGDDPSSKNLQILNAIQKPTMTGTWVAASSITFSASGSDINIADRKLWYVSGQKVVVTCFAISDAGEYKFLGQSLLTVTT
jgi:hypothetical protein